MAILCVNAVLESARLKLHYLQPTICVRDQAQDIHVVGGILRNGLFEPQIVHAFYKKILQHKDAIVLDVGSHIGQYSIVAASAGARVVAFEANADNCKYLRASLAENHWEDRVTLINRPVSNVSGQRIKFKENLPQQNTGDGEFGSRPTGIS